MNRRIAWNVTMISHNPETQVRKGNMDADTSDRSGLECCFPPHRIGELIIRQILKLMIRVILERNWYYYKMIDNEIRNCDKAVDGGLCINCTIDRMFV